MSFSDLDLKRQKDALKKEVKSFQTPYEDIAALEESWQERPFEKIKIKGLKVRDRDYTIEDLMKASKIIKSHIDRMNKKKEIQKRSESLSFAFDKESQSLPQDSTAKKDKPVLREEKGKPKEKSKKIQK